VTPPFPPRHSPVERAARERRLELEERSVGDVLSPAEREELDAHWRELARHGDAIRAEAASYVRLRR
jgi:hypothetical protein